MSNSNQSVKKWGDTVSKRGEISRIFVGNIDYKLTSCEDLDKKFSIYGKITGIDINPNGFSFLQFAHVDDALRAVKNEHGTLLNQRKLEVKMFNKNGSSKKKLRGRSRSPFSNRFHQVNSTYSLQRENSSFPFVSQPHPIPNYSRNANIMGPSPPLQPHASFPGNDIEIIVVNKNQWAYAEMIERKLREETPLEYIDLLFLHSSQHISMTLNDLFERRTLYAIVVTPANEEHKSCTLHMLHNQTEHRNIPIEEVIPLVRRDFMNYMSRNESGNRTKISSEKPSLNNSFVFSKNEASQPQSTSLGFFSSSLPPSLHSSFNPSSSREPISLNAFNGSSIQSNSSLISLPIQNFEKDKQLPPDIAYLLKTTLTENGIKFLSLSQIDSIIEYFVQEKERLTSQTLRRPIISNQNNNETNFDYQSEKMNYPSNPSLKSSLTTGLLDNPQVKAALNSLIQIGAIRNSSSNELPSKNLFTKLDSESDKSCGSLPTDAPSYMSTSNLNPSSSHHISNPPSYSSSTLPGQNTLLRRYPLFGDEVSGSSGPGYSSSLRFNNPEIGFREYQRSSHRH